MHLNTCSRHYKEATLSRERKYKQNNGERVVKHVKKSNILESKSLITS